MARQLRVHDQVLRERIGAARLVCVTGPRQVGKTASCSALSPHYVDCNNVADRLVMLRGPAALIQHLGLDDSREREPVLVIDNLHGHRNWKGLVRRLTAAYGAGLRLVVSTLEPPRGNLPADSFILRINPWSVGECARAAPPDGPIKPPAPIGDEDWAGLLEHGGFPEPFSKRDSRITRRWNTRRWEELIRDDLPRLAAVRDPDVVQMLAMLLAGRSGTHLIYSELSRELNVTVDTVRRWLDLMERLQFGFRVRPWFARVPKALRKEPKWFLRDWSGVTDPLARARTVVACHLLKAAQGWTDLGFGQFELRYVRDKTKREIDFLMLRDRKPWFLVAVSLREGSDPALEYFQSCTRAQHAFHVVMGNAYSASDCFSRTGPVVVPARTLLSQLL
jgi:predicted AAA+ superfamily ATPase